MSKTCREALESSLLVCGRYLRSPDGILRLPTAFTSSLIAARWAPCFVRFFVVAELPPRPRRASGLSIPASCSLEWLTYDVCPLYFFRSSICELFAVADLPVEEAADPALSLLLITYWWSRFRTVFGFMSSPFSSWLIWNGKTEGLSILYRLTLLAFESADFPIG